MVPPSYKLVYNPHPERPILKPQCLKPPLTKDPVPNGWMFKKSSTKIQGLTNMYVYIYINLYM